MMEKIVVMAETINILESCMGNPSKGLPDEVFFFVSRITPLINVDLLIKNELGQTLLTWRADNFYTGWHIPGGIIRFKETIAERIKAVAENELEAEVEFDPALLAMNEKINTTRNTRGHFISLLYRCHLTKQPSKRLRCKDNVPNPGEWKWHSSCPDNIVSVHEMYRKFI